MRDLFFHAAWDDEVIFFLTTKDFPGLGHAEIRWPGAESQAGRDASSVLLPM